MTVARERIDAVMFDLDGTLIDSRPGIEASARSALDEVGLESEAPIQSSWLGAPLAGLILSLVPHSEPGDRELVTLAFKRHYDDIGWKSSHPYDGVGLVLERLRRSGLRLFVVTNKRRDPTLAILAWHELVDYFEAVYTPDSRDPGYASKGEMGQACIREHALTPSSTLVVGDSRDDLEMARECGTVFGAASWGYGGIDADAAARWAGSERFSDPPDILLAALTDLEVLMHTQAGGKTSR